MIHMKDTFVKLLKRPTELGTNPVQSVQKPIDKGNKRSYTEKLRNKFLANDRATEWKGLKDITNYWPPSPHSVDNQELADDINMFYCRFDTLRPISHIHFNNLSTHPTISTLTVLRICEDDACQMLLKENSRKSTGPDGVSPSCLRTCADQLLPFFTQIFNRSLEQCEVPSCFTLSSSPSQKIQDHRVKGLQTCLLNACDHEVL